MPIQILIKIYQAKGISASKNNTRANHENIKKQ